MNSKSSRNRMRFLFLIYVFFAVILVFSAVFLQRDYQDSWVLEGLTIQTLLVAIPFLILAINIRSSSRLVLLIASFLMLLSLVVNLKYVQISGVFDSIAHYGFTNRLISTGHVPETGFYAREYSGTPGMHIFLASLTQVTGLSTTVAIKLFLVIVSAMPPFILYLLIKNVTTESSRRFLLLGTCFTLPLASILFGTTFALPMYFLFISVFLRQTIMSGSSRSFSVILIIIAPSLIISHGITPLFLTVLMFCTPFVLKILSFVRREKSPLRLSKYLHFALFLSIFLLSWWMSTAKYLFNSFLVNTIQSIFLKTTAAISIPSAFMELSFLEQLTLGYIRFYQLIIIIILSLVGLILYLKVYRKDYSKTTQDTYFHVICIIIATIIISIPFLFSLQGYTFERFIIYSKLLSPLFIGLSLFSLANLLRFNVKRKSVQNILFTLFLLLLFIPFLFVVYAPQPLIPTNNENEYLVDYRSVNTIYQISMIQFAEVHHTTGFTIAADTVTSWQIFGLTNTSFYSDYIWDNPLSENKTQGDLILLHYSGVAGPLNEKVDYRTRSKLNELKYTMGNNVIYDNGESFIIVPIP